MREASDKDSVGMKDFTISSEEDNNKDKDKAHSETCSKSLRSSSKEAHEEVEAKEVNSSSRKAKILW